MAEIAETGTQPRGIGLGTTFENGKSSLIELVRFVVVALAIVHERQINQGPVATLMSSFPCRFSEIVTACSR